ncbi:hypothetical protein A7982_12451 [Minicystis rosea]|nr:hypothetical protein A7982_12451 [Minicystis rosea]
MALPAVASAQDQIWLRDRRYTVGPGYRAGDFEIHPGAAAEFGFDSNYLRRSAGDDQVPVLSSLRLRITPSLSVTTLGLQRRDDGAQRPTVEFRAGASLTYNEFFPVAAPTAATAEIMRAQRNLGAAADLGLAILPGRPWSGVLNLSYMRAITPTDQGAEFVPSTKQVAFNRDLPRASAELVWTPGAGLFEWRLGYSFAGTVFEDSDFGQLTSITNAITTRGRWRFLPRTSLMYDASFGFINYTNPEAAGQGGKLSSHPMRARLGINGLITPSFSILALAGWGASFYKVTPDAPDQNFDSVIGQLELKWFLTPNPSANTTQASPSLSAISVGFLRDFYDSYIGNYFERDRGYLSFSYFYGGKFLIVLEGGAGPVIYPKFLSKAAGEQEGFTDIRFDASLFAEYRFKDQFGVSASVRYNENVNKHPIPVSDGKSDDLSFRQIETYLGFRWLM